MTLTLYRNDFVLSTTNALPGQLEMFATTPSTSIRGLMIEIPRVCQCGSRESIIGSSGGPHLARLTCAACGRHAGWLPNRASKFLERILDKFGRPDRAIVWRDEE